MNNPIKISQKGMDPVDRIPFDRDRFQFVFYGF